MRIRKSAKRIKSIVSGLEHKEGSDYYRFGFNFFGPFLYGFIMWLHENIQKQGIEKILFFARDGYMMQNAYDLLDDAVETEYVYFSRKSLRQALLCHAKDYNESLKYYSWKRFVSVAEILDFYGFDSNEFGQIAADNSLDLGKEYTYEELPASDELARLYNVLKDEIVRRSAKQSDLLLKYIEQIGLNDKCAIVDIGWHGNMQYYLEEFLNINGLDINLRGYYVGIDPVRSVRGELYGYLYSGDDKSLRKSTLCFFGIYEKLFQSLEGSTKGYAEVNGKVDVVKAEYEYSNDPDMVEVIKDMQRGAMDCFNLLSRNEDQTIGYKEYAMPLLLYGEKPSVKDALLFKNMYNTDGIKTYFLPQKPLSQYKLKEFKRDLSNSSWKTGFLKVSFKVPFPYDLIYKVFRK